MLENRRNLGVGQLPALRPGPLGRKSGSLARSDPADSLLSRSRSCTGWQARGKTSWQTRSSSTDGSTERAARVTWGRRRGHRRSRGRHSSPVPRGSAQSKAQPSRGATGPRGSGRGSRRSGPSPQTGCDATSDEPQAWAHGSRGPGSQERLERSLRSEGSGWRSHTDDRGLRPRARRTEAG